MTAAIIVGIVGGSLVSIVGIAAYYADRDDERDTQLRLARIARGLPECGP